MDCSHASLLGLPVELRLSIYEYILEWHRDRAGKPTYTRVRYIHDTSDHSTKVINVALDLQQVCTTFDLEIQQQISLVPAFKIAFEDFDHVCLGRWLNTFDSQGLYKIQSVECSLASKCQFLQETHSDSMKRGRPSTRIDHREFTTCPHDCDDSRQARWTRLDSGTLHQKGLCRIEIDFSRLRRDIVAGDCGMGDLLGSPDSFEPPLLNNGYVKGYHCDVEHGHFNGCIRPQLQGLRSFVPNGSPLGDTLSFRKGELATLCNLGIQAVMSGSVTLSNNHAKVLPTRIRGEDHRDFHLLI